MNLALLRKTAYDFRFHLIITMTAAMAFPILLLNAITAFDWEAFQTVLKVPFVSQLISALGGFDPSNVMNVTALASFTFVHPAMLVLFWAYIITAATRTITGEIDQGTADILLALPISRKRIYTTTSGWAIICCPLLSLSLVLGLWIAQNVVELDQPLDFPRIWLIGVNHSAILLAVVGIAFFVAAMSNRRGLSVGIIVGILITSFIINWLAAIWPAIKTLSYASILYYFRPFIIVRDHELNPTDLITLLAIAITFWLTGCITYTRRDINVG